MYNGYQGDPADQKAMPHSAVQPPILENPKLALFEMWIRSTSGRERTEIASESISTLCPGICTDTLQDII